MSGCRVIKCTPAVYVLCAGQQQGAGLSVASMVRADWSCGRIVCIALLHFAACTLRDRFATSMVAKMSAPAAFVKRSAQTALEVCVCGNQP